jgi:hypothetical protein
MIRGAELAAGAELAGLAALAGALAEPMSATVLRRSSSEALLDTMVHLGPFCRR